VFAKGVRECDDSINERREGQVVVRSTQVSSDERGGGGF
jgi:hypothetical protein